MGEEVFLSNDDIPKYVNTEESITKEALLSFSRVICQAGDYKDDSTDRFKCQHCPEGSWSAKDETKCHACPAGQYAAEHLSCKLCPPGSYSVRGKDSCTLCDVKEVSEMKGTICTKCPSGKYADKVANKCKPCPRGTFSQESSCPACPAGTYSGTGETQCHACIPGQYFDPKLHTCVDCRASYYSSSPLLACRKCVPGTYSRPKESSCHTCPAGQRVNAAQTKCTGISPTSSPPPTLSPTIHAGCNKGEEYNSKLRTCQRCYPGYFSSTGVKCEPCASQYFAVAPGMVFCILCPEGGVVNAARSKCDISSTPTPVPVPTSIPTPAPTPSPSSEILCPIGEPGDYDIGGAPYPYRCKIERGEGPCLFGQVFDMRMNKCVDCPAGTYSTNYLHRDKCGKCTGKYWSPALSTWCLTCDPYQRPNDDHSKCVPQSF